MGNTAISTEQRCDLLVTLKVRMMILSKQQEPSMNQKRLETETESVFCITVLCIKESLHLAFCNYSLTSISVGSMARSGSAFLRILSYLHLYSCLWGCVLNRTRQPICTIDRLENATYFYPGPVLQPSSHHCLTDSRTSVTGTGAGTRKVEQQSTLLQPGLPA